MSFRDPVRPPLDILESVRMIEDFTASLTFEHFREDPKTVAAVERKVLVIGEAAVRLGREAPFVIPDVPWRQIRDLGNLSRHAYDKVDLEIIWRTITDDLPALKAAVLKVLSPPPANPEGPSPD